MPITLELSPPMYQQANRLALSRGENVTAFLLSLIKKGITEEEQQVDANAILHLARQRSKRFDNLSRSELVDRLFDVGEAIRQEAILEKTTIEDIPLNGR